MENEERTSVTEEEKALLATIINPDELDAWIARTLNSEFVGEIDYLLSKVNSA